MRDFSDGAAARSPVVGVHFPPRERAVVVADSGLAEPNHLLSMPQHMVLLSVHIYCQVDACMQSSQDGGYLVKCLDI